MLLGREFIQYACKNSTISYADLCCSLASKNIARDSSRLPASAVRCRSVAEQPMGKNIALRWLARISLFNPRVGRLARYAFRRVCLSSLGTKAAISTASRSDARSGIRLGKTRPIFSKSKAFRPKIFLAL